ncbi:pre-mRNA-processing protein 40A-like isoform X1 [Syzygium oleosum]|uniref:pre-mRNA-processing protein 40A-like isoform X1 n=1 Tax=Syzygium oleosum TaxID=219896 RepID=UPI0024BAED86|nr:pre-mRNA-processing protein 40A-like isoform X1 [Syzygium oleosum]
MANDTQFSGFQPLQPPVVGSADPPRNFTQPVPVPPWPALPPQQPQQFVSTVPQHFQPPSHVTLLRNIGLPSAPQHPQFPPPVQHLVPRPGQPVQNILPPPPPLPISQQNKPIASESSRPHQPSGLVPNNFVPAGSGLRAPLSSSYTLQFASHGGQQQGNFVAPRPPSLYHQMSQPQVSGVSSGDQVNLPSESQKTTPVTVLPVTSEQPAVSAALALEPSVQHNSSEAVQRIQTDWIEHTSAAGRKYYYNKKTKQSTWEKPFELMTVTERADASTDWKEFTSSDGRIYYYNKVTKQSKWEMPAELKLAREETKRKLAAGTQSESLPSSSTSVVPVKELDGSNISSLTSQGATSSPVPVAPLNASGDTESAVVAESEEISVPVPASTLAAVVLDISVDDAEQMAVVQGSNEVAADTIDDGTTPMIDSEKSTIQDIPCSAGVSVQDKEAKKNEVIAEGAERLVEEKLINSESSPYANKLEAKAAFNALLENANISSDWTWERAMRVIINDKRYGALKTLGERKEAFNEFVGQRKKQEVEDRRIQQKKARDNFKQMLEECRELTSSSRWSKVVTLFEEDERFKAVERDKDRKDIFESFINELEKKERERSLEERKKNIREYRQFLESCDFIKASSQWRKLQDRLEADERCSRLEKIDRLEIFQDYLHELEKEEEEQRKIQKEEMRKAERKNRDEFRKLMEEHVAAGTLTAKTLWRDYYMTVKDLPAYMAVASNTAGSTPKDLFEDVAEELQKQYEEDKSQVDDAVKLRKISLTSTWTVEDLRGSIADDMRGAPISEINFKLVFDDLLERARKKEERVAKKRKRLGDKLFDLLTTIREITPSSTWDECKQLIENSHEYSSIGDDIYCQDIFEEYITKLKDHETRKHKEEKAEKEKKKRGKERKRVKDRREKDRYDREEEESRDNGADSDREILSETRASYKRKKSGEDRERKRHRHIHRTADYMDIAEAEHSEKNHRHNGDHKKATQPESTPESDSESRHKRHKRDHRNGYHRSGGYEEELEDGEFGEDIRAGMLYAYKKGGLHMELRTHMSSGGNRGMG